MSDSENIMIEYLDATEGEEGSNEETPDAYVVLVGDLTTGHRSVGPFASFEEADAWTSQHVGPTELSWVMDLMDPNSQDAVTK